MINKIRRALTGYKVSKISKNGLEIKTSYKGKFPSSDPLAALKDVKLKLDKSPIQLSVNSNMAVCWEEKIKVLDGTLPTYSAKFKVGKNQYRISRFVAKQNKSPLSLYTFSNNGKIFALFTRIYDYGEQFKEIENCLISNGSIEQSASNRSMLYITNVQHSALLDVFGHSQSFFWNDRDELEKCLDVIKL
ncbi:hypothetical protein SAMN04489724_0569 [Algoriphagus locisalis]|uniref:Uncharacterized protein n=1 Tax=Algoriphagus locisalis TaxID=305507 RepID=A0A1I6XMA7_9BACT|nr:hypothetical protein [Algoriphagus locisalis]SFT39518.1 hypothetical protein SAMN04489724_0569 [Algoriphagus locisalis]